MARHTVQAKSIPDELFMILDLIRNADEYGTRMTALQAAIDQHNKLVEDVAGLEGIEAARLNATLDRKQAKDELAAAQAEAANLVARAQELVKKVEGEIAAQRSALDARAADLAMSEAQLAQARTQFEARVASVSNGLAEREQKLMSRRQEHEAAVAAFEVRRKKLESALA